MSSERARRVEQGIRDAGLTPSLVDIDRNDDRPYAKFAKGSDYVTITGDGDSDEAATADIIEQARRSGLGSN